MAKNYIVIKNIALDAVLYHDKNDIIMRNNFGEEKVIIKEVHDEFSVSSTPKGNLLVFYREKDGAAYLSKLTAEGVSEKRRLMPCDGFTESNNCVYSQSETLGACFFYTLPTSKKNIYTLYATNFSSDEGVKIETIMTQGARAFYLLGGNKPVLGYVNQQNMLILCVFNGETLAEHQKYIVSRRGDSILDITCLERAGVLHICYITEQTGKRHLIYKRIGKEGLSRNSNLMSKSKLTHCTMFIYKDTLFIFGVSKEGTYCTFSKDMGASFYDSAPYFRHVPKPEKADFIGAESNDLCARESFVDEGTPLLLENYYPQYENGKRAAENEISKLKNRLIIFEKELKDKDSQVNQMSKTVAQSQQQSSVFMEQWSKRYEEVVSERNGLRQTISVLRGENDSLRAQIAHMAQQMQSQRPAEQMSAASKPAVQEPAGEQLSIDESVKEEE